MSDARAFLTRAVDAEEQLRSARERIADLEDRLRAAIGRDPEEYNTLALRLSACETLLAELWRWVQENPSLLEVLPDGFEAKLRAQLNAAVVVHAAAESATTTTIVIVCSRCQGHGKVSSGIDSPPMLCAECGGLGRAMRVQQRTL